MNKKCVCVTFLLIFIEKYLRVGRWKTTIVKLEKILLFFALSMIWILISNGKQRLFHTLEIAFKKNLLLIRSCQKFLKLRFPLFIHAQNSVTSCSLVPYLYLYQIYPKTWDLNLGLSVGLILFCKIKSISMSISF